MQNFRKYKVNKPVKNCNTQFQIKCLCKKKHYTPLDNEKAFLYTKS